MIVVKARILHRSVFLAGETITCQLVVSRTSADLNNEDNQRIFTNNEAIETLAWASSQLHCQCLVNEKKLKLNNKYGVNTSQEIGNISLNTSFLPVQGEKGYCIFATKPTIMFCDLQLKEGESRSFLYSEVIPSDALPFYKGNAVRYSYKLTIGIGRLGKPSSLLKLPFRVLSTKGVHESYCEACEPNGTNPFLVDDTRQCLVLDHLVESLSSLTMKRSTNTYNVLCSNGTVGKFYLHRMCYRIGEDISGTFDFTTGDVPCIKYSVVLQSVESISEDCLIDSNHSKPNYASYSRKEECCYNIRKSTFSLPIPITVTPSFSSKIVSLSWRLHFEFITSLRDQDESSKYSNPPSSLPAEIMAWDLPIDVIATNPLQVSMMVQSNHVAKVIVD